jgi:hypothetical protein
MPRPLCASHLTGSWKPLPPPPKKKEKNRGLTSIYPLALIDDILENVPRLRVLRSPPVTSPAQPLRASCYVEQRTVLRILDNTHSPFAITVATAPLLSALDSLLDAVLDLDDGVSDGLVLLAAAPHHDAGDLDDADDTEEEVDGGEEVVLGLDDEAPAGPDEAGGRQGAVLLQGELLGGAGEVGDAGEDEGPLQERRIQALASCNGWKDGLRYMCRRDVTFMTGAQKCTVLKPMGLSHMRLNQPTWAAACCSALAVDCHLRPHCCRCWVRKACWKPDAREKACRVWAAAEAEEKRGRDARVKAAAAAEEDIVSLVVVAASASAGWQGQRTEGGGRPGRNGGGELRVCRALDEVLCVCVCVTCLVSLSLSLSLSLAGPIQARSGQTGVRSNRGPIRGALGVNRR